MDIEEIAQLNLDVANKATVYNSQIMNRDIYDDKHRNGVILKKLPKFKD